MEGLDSGDIFANTMCRQEAASEMSDVQAHGEDIWIEEAEMVVITELYEGLCL